MGTREPYGRDPESWASVSWSWEVPSVRTGEPRTRTPPVPPSSPPSSSPPLPPTYSSWLRSSHFLSNLHSGSMCSWLRPQPTNLLREGTGRGWGAEPLRPALPGLSRVWPHPSLDSLELSSIRHFHLPPQPIPRGAYMLPLGRWFPKRKIAETRILGTQSRPTESETVGVRLSG